MYCPNCGRNVNDTAKFCPGCGTPLDSEEQQNQTAVLLPEISIQESSLEVTPGVPVEQDILSGAAEAAVTVPEQAFINGAAPKAEKKQKMPKKQKNNKKKSKFGLVLIILAIIGLTGGAVVFCVSKTTKAKKVEKQLTLGEKYLLELEYEQAIAAYEKAIKIDPKNTEAYLGLADVYIEMGDFDKVEEVLKEAKDVITKKEDKERIERKGKKIEQSWKEKEDEEGEKVTSTPEKTPTLTSTPSQIPSQNPSLIQTPAPTKTPSSVNAEELKKASVGDYITFGTYEQDNNLSNGAEPIEWLILDKKDGKALVLSKYALDTKPYNEEEGDVTWETCSLRSWLNDFFYTTAFNKKERSLVVETLIKNDNPFFLTEGGKDTKDKVFLLSYEEATTYFDPDSRAYDLNRTAKVTEYAKMLGGFVYEEALMESYGTTVYDGTGWWWLRTPGYIESSFFSVNFTGNCEISKSIAKTHVVRPAMWIAYEEPETSDEDSMTPTGKVEALQNASVGDYITFGTYEQDNNLENGAEPIEWLVLEKKDGKALVLSKYALDEKPYNIAEVDVVTWETCTLRSWLNDEFYTTAFNNTERSAVVETLIKNEDNPERGTEGGNDTKDKVFLLSMEEITTYFDPATDARDPARRAKVTEYAKSKGGLTYEEAEYGHYGTTEYDGNGVWWLRSPGYQSILAVEVNYRGEVTCYGSYIVGGNRVVRPALWLAYDEQESIPTFTPTPSPTPTPTPTPTKPLPFDKVDELKNSAVGNYITFGTYEQDNNLENGAEPIEWLVLDKKDGKAFVLSKYALECKEYDEFGMDFDSLEFIWETCTLRSWLNEEFYMGAFNEAERSAIAETLVINEDNPEYGTEGGNDTKDKVFLLSLAEVETYFDWSWEEGDPLLKAKVTEHAKAQGASLDRQEVFYGNGWWWLRSPGADSSCIAVVGFDGRPIDCGIGLYDYTVVVRPAMWVAY